MCSCDNLCITSVSQLNKLKIISRYPTHLNTVCDESKHSLLPDALTAIFTSLTFIYTANQRTILNFYKPFPSHEGEMPNRRAYATDQSVTHATPTPLINYHYGGSHID